MKVELELWSSAEISLVGELIQAIAQMRRVAEIQMAVPVGEVSSNTEPLVGEIVPEKAAKKTRKTQKDPALAAPYAEVAKAMEASVAVATLPEPTPAPAPEPATAPVPAPAVASAAPKKEVLEDKVRGLAKTNFVAVKALLAKYGVERFGKLAEDKYTAFGVELFAVPEFPAPVAA